jgi:ATP-dependent DNA helicase
MNCRLIKELLTYNSANRLLITGTPLQNNISELWSLLHFLLPDVFNDLNSFESWFDFSSVLDNSGQAGLVEHRKRNLVTTMHAILKPFLLRRVKTDVETSLPKKREYILYAPLTAEQKDLYREILNGTGRQYLEGQAFDRLAAKNESLSRSMSRKRSRESSDASSLPNKSVKSSRSATPASTSTSTTGSLRRRRSVRQSYKEMNDRDFDAKLRQLEKGIEEEPEIVEQSESELEELERAKTIKLASMYLRRSSSIAANPTQQKRKLDIRKCRTRSCKHVWHAIPLIISTGLGQTNRRPLTRPSCRHPGKCSCWTA